MIQAHRRSPAFANDLSKRIIDTEAAHAAYSRRHQIWHFKATTRYRRRQKTARHLSSGDLKRRMAVLIIAMPLNGCQRRDMKISACILMANISKIRLICPHITGDADGIEKWRR